MSTEVADLLPTVQLEVDKQVKKGKGLKILTPNKLLTSLHLLLAQTKAARNSYKLKIKIRQILHLLDQHNKITKKNATFNLIFIIIAVNIGDNKLVVAKEPKTFHVDIPKNVDIILKHEICFMIKHNFQPSI